MLGESGRGRLMSGLSGIRTELTALRQEGGQRGEDRKLLVFCFAAVFCWGLAAHAFGFLRTGYSHDMLNALVADSGETYWKMQLGRPGIVLYRKLLRGETAAPWLLGMLSLCWLSLSSFLTVKLFRIRGRLFPILTAGVLTVNISTIGMTAGYLYEMDANLYAVLLGVCAVFLWDRGGWKGALCGVPLIAFCLGTYQSMVSVPITVAMLLCMAALLRGEDAASVFRRGLLAIGMLALGALLYWGGLRLMCAWKGINLSMNSYNRLDQTEVPLTLSARFLAVYKSWIAAFWKPSESHIEPAVLWLNVLLPLAALLRILPWLFRRSSSGSAKGLFLLLLVLLPFGMNTAQLGFPVAVHDLMKYAFWLFRLFCVLPFFLLPGPETGEKPSEAEPGEKPPYTEPTERQPVRSGQGLKTAVSILLLMILFSHTVTANRVYTRKALEQDACLSLMSRVVYRLEEREDYIPGETPLVFVGASEQLQERLYGFEDTYDITGCESAFPITKSIVSYNYNTYAAYFRYVLNNPAVMADTETWMRLQRDPGVKEMPSYPAEGCMRETDGVLVVKMSDFASGGLY